MVSTIILYSLIFILIDFNLNWFRPYFPILVETHLLQRIERASPPTKTVFLLKSQFFSKEMNFSKVPTSKKVNYEAKLKCSCFQLKIMHQFQLHNMWEILIFSFYNNWPISFCFSMPRIQDYLSISVWLYISFSLSVTLCLFSLSLSLSVSLSLFICVFICVSVALSSSFFLFFFLPLYLSLFLCHSLSFFRPLSKYISIWVQ